MSKKAVILGGGVAGMSAAHELVERGFMVEVYELNSIAGGKARSINIPGSAQGNRKPLPGEHGFRFFPKFYTHVPDTMKRIPFKNNANGIFDNLVYAHRAEMSRNGKKPLKILTEFPNDIGDLEFLLRNYHDMDTGLTKEDIKIFADRLWQLMTSCEERRLAEYEQISWWDYIQADGKSEPYQNLLAIGLTRTLVAAKAKEASARTGGDIILQLMFDMMLPGQSSADRLLNGPTNDVWIDPWLTYLTAKGVRYNKNAKVVSINCDGKKVTGASIEQNGNITEVTGDYYISALPVEVFDKFITPELIKADAGLANIKELATCVSWMNGIQFYLKEDIDIINGHTIFIDSQWALTSISQKQFWSDINFNELGDGTVKGILSVDISDWFNPGELFPNANTGKNKTAAECTREEIQKEVWHQLKKSLNFESELLQDKHLHSWFLDPDILFEHEGRPHTTINMEPLLINKKDTWKLRPEAVTKIPNLFLASDYMRTYTDLATMEGANEAARRAVNGIIESSGIKADKCELWPLQEPWLLNAWKKHDKKRFDKGLHYNGQLSDNIIVNFIFKGCRIGLRYCRAFLRILKKKG